MNEKQREKWKKTRAKGRLRYVVFEGLFWALISTTATYIFDYFYDYQVFQHLMQHFIPHLIPRLLVSALICCAIFWLIWNRREKNFSQNSH